MSEDVKGQVINEMKASPKFDTLSSSVPYVWTLPIERKRFEPRVWDDWRNKVILRTESKWVLVLLQWRDLLEKFYLTDIFEKLNNLNLKLKGMGTNSIQLRDNLQALHSKLQNWRRKVMQETLLCFRIVRCCRKSRRTWWNPKTSTIEHLRSLEIEFLRYFPELKEEEAALVLNLFFISLVIIDIPDELQDQFGDLVHIETKVRNRTTVKDHMRLALPNTRT